MQEHEASFLSCVLIDPSLIFKTKLTERQFLQGETRQLFRAMQECANRKIAIDYISVNEADPTMDKTFAVRIRDTQPSAANWKFYEDRIIESFQRERLVYIGRKLSEITDSSDPCEYIERAEKDLLDLATGINSTEIVRLASLLPDTIKKIEDRYKNKGKLPGVSTGLNELDAKLGGFQPGRYYVIGARPSDGKSALATNIACHIGIREGVAVGIISAESSNTEIVTRMFSAEGHINGQTLTMGTIKAADFLSLMQAGENMYEAPIFLYDAPNVRFQEMKSVCRQMVAVHKVKVIFVDYLQILQWHNQNIAKHEQVAAISLGLKELARELRTPIIALSQLKRDSEGREPEMADLDYSKQIEQDADAIVLIYHPKPAQRKEGQEECEPKPSMLLIKKNRDGPKGAVMVNFKREYVRFYEVDTRGQWA